jgi:hypothetical protein
MPVHVLTDSEYSAFKQALIWIKGFKVTGGGASFKNAPEGATLTLKDAGTLTPSGASTVGFFPVLVSATAGGSAGPPASYAYNVYRLTDTGYSSALSTSALSPTTSSPRINGESASVAATGSVGMAYIASNGSIALYSVLETPYVTNCA